MPLPPPCARARDGESSEHAWRVFDDALTTAEALTASRSVVSTTEDGRLRASVRERGFGFVRDLSRSASERARDERLARRAKALAERGFDPTWIAVWDDFWDALKALGARVRDRAFTGLVMNYDVLAWVVDPTTDEKTSAFGPHRDRQPEDTKGSFRGEDGQARYVTAWVPLFHDATTRNSCLYCVPRECDPGYFEGDDDDGDDPMRVALSSKEKYQHVTALPVKAGECVLFTHRLIHWGSVGQGEEGEPRVNFSVGFADDFEPPYLKDSPEYPTHEERVALVAGQLICYHERFPSSAKDLSTLKKLFDAAKGSFDPNYVKKVTKEFASAAFEVESDEDDAIDDALDAMIENVDDFDDDFDSFEDGVPGDEFGRAEASQSDDDDDGKDTVAKRRRES